MARLIPKEAVEDVKRLFQLTEDQREALLEAIANAKPRDDVYSFADEVSEKMDLPDSAALVRVVSNLYIYYDRLGITTESLVKGIADECKLTDIDFEDDTDFLSKLFSNESTIGVTSKAQRLILEQERSYCKAHIVTDSRPIFGKDVDKGPLGAVIYHNIELSYHSSGKGGLKSFYVSADDDDLVELKRLIDRAIHKSKAIRKMSSAQIIGGSE